MALTIINDTPKRGAYIGGFNIAPDGLLILADSFDSAWDLMVEHYADQGALAEVEEVDIDDMDGIEHADGTGYVCTLDLVMRVVRPAPRD